ncbi:hypothetical protein [Paenibacillus sp. FSL R7-0128]|uniref:hypothetical protein n=1 Tax=Paenibacillus sp. FSL R7-0128 TaxID=2954529 RepID=UPI0030F67D10
MDVIILASQPFRITAVTRKTRAELFKDAAVGDILRFSLAMEGPGRCSGGGSYACVVKTENLTQGTSTHNTLNRISERLRGFDIIPHVPAQVIPFPNPVAETIESFARLARSGEITGVVMAALGPGRLAEDTYSAITGVNYTERRALISTLEDAATVAMLDATDDY